MDQEDLFSFTLHELPQDRLDETSFYETEQVLLKHVVDYASDPRIPLWNLSRFYSASRHHVEALECLNRLYVHCSDLEEKAACLVGLGCQLECVGDWKAAIAKFREAMALEPSQPVTWFSLNCHLGSALNHHGSFADAEFYCRNAVKLNSGDSSGFKILGIALEGQEKLQEAAKAYVSALRVDATDNGALQRLEALLATDSALKSEFQDRLNDRKIASTFANHEREKATDTAIRRVKRQSILVRMLNRILKAIKSLF